MVVVDSASAPLGSSGTVDSTISSRTHLDRLLSYPEWSSTPGKVSFLWCLLNLGFFVVLWLSGEHGAGGVLVEIAAWVPISLAVPRLVRGPFSAVSYSAIVFLLALVEETLAYSTGGGLHGAATSLGEDWLRAVPTFVGLGVGLFASVRATGLLAPEAFAAAAASGIVIEIGLGTGFNPIAFLALGGAASWVYGTILALPIERNKPPLSAWIRVSVTVALLAVGALVGGLVGIALECVFRL